MSAPKCLICFPPCIGWTFHLPLLYGFLAVLALAGCNTPKPPPASPTEEALPDCRGPQKSKDCMVSGLKLQHGDGAALRPKRALALFERVCEQGEEKGCVLAAHLYRTGADAGPDYPSVPRAVAKALALYESACSEHQNVVACSRAGDAYQAGRLGAKTDPQKATRYLQTACDSGEDPDACRVVERVKASRDRSPQSHVKACEAGEVARCAEVGFGLINGSTGQKEPARGLSLLTKGCKGGDGPSCTWLGVALERGLAGVSDPRAALIAYQSGCAAGHVAACRIAGKRYFDGVGGPKDMTKALDFSQTACNGGDPDGCFLAAVIYKRGIAGSPDPVRAQEHLKKACVGGIKPACKLLEGR